MPPPPVPLENLNPGEDTRVPLDTIIAPSADAANHLTPTSVFASCPPRQKHKTQGADASIKTQKHKTQTKEYVKNTKTRVFSPVFSQN